MKRWSENRTFAACALLCALGLAVSIATGADAAPGGRIRAVLVQAVP